VAPAPAPCGSLRVPATVPARSRKIAAAASCDCERVGRACRLPHEETLAMNVLRRLLAAWRPSAGGPRANRRSFEYEADIGAPPERVFPLLCPIREQDWIEGWKATVVYSASGTAERGALFRTRIASGELWITTRHEPPARVEYAIVAGTHAVLELALALRPSSPGAARLSIQRTYTGLDAIGRSRVAALREDAIRREDELLVRRLDHYLATGEPLRGTGAIAAFGRPRGA
jgi:hypothetical protein